MDGMKKIAFVFAGQGAQYPGMGKTLYEASPAAKAVFDACEAIRPGTIAQCFEGTDEEMKETVNTQPCMFAVELAAAEAMVNRLLEKYGTDYRVHYLDADRDIIKKITYILN